MTTTYLLAGGRRVRAHPVADVFPLLSKDEITALAADIQTHGQRLPVLLQRADDGADLVLDGRNRLLACEEAGLEPLVAEVEPAADAVRVIVSVNLVRRHQGDSQRAMSAARLVNLARGRPAQIASIDAISQGMAAGLLCLGRATVQRAVAILHDPILAPAVDAGEVAVSDAYAIRHESDEAKRRALATVTDGTARTLRGALEREAAGPATVGLEPPSEHAGASADAVTRFASATRARGSERPVVRSAAAGSPSEREVAETSTAGATDAEAHPPVASEPSGTEAADPAGGSTLSDSASSGDRGSGGRTAAVRDSKWGGADSSPDPAPLLPAPAPVGGREAADAHVRGVDVATVGKTGCDADAERRVPTSGSTDSGASDDSEATDAVVGGAPSESTPSSDSKAGGGAMAVRGGECGQPPAGPAAGVGGADSSPDSAPLLPAAVVGREAADAQGVDAATAGQIAGDDAELRRCLTELRSAAERLGTVSLGRSSRVEAACRLVQALVAAMERYLDSGRDEQVLVAGLPAALAPSLDALSTPIGQGSPLTEDEGDADGRGRGSATLEQASNTAGLLKTLLGWNRRSQQ
ncbi:MAG: hypothetical protein F4X11_06315 [Acidobacteria bacterium]|nr:hypothetical protein [Acidobacteriota bacterium]